MAIGIHVGAVVRGEDEGGVADKECWVEGEEERVREDGLVVW